ncbi:hypothetical protein TorRG33x02_041930 [Trema orientale]|uniref:Uncharacterized protein n=1 Tax=Trema orientale TaxID=63057 RepID=A0A2P5FQI8_TREOI|nr:hypothetical protein TorRG33x02_041930 [Trema orientale]
MQDEICPKGRGEFPSLIPTAKGDLPYRKGGVWIEMINGNVTQPNGESVTLPKEICPVELNPHVKPSNHIQAHVSWIGVPTATRVQKSLIFLKALTTPPPLQQSAAIS